MRILLGLTGSVATVLYEKIITELQTIAPVTVILTESSKHFVSSDFLRGCKVFTDENEWRWFDNKSGEFHNIWEKDDSVLHIKLRETYSAFVIAPCSMNTLAKITNGICDNLLTSVARAWDFNRPFIIAPAANTLMYEHPLTEAQFETFSSFGGYVVPAQSKMLACGTEGMGAMANIKDIVSALKEKLQWRFPLGNIFGYKKIDDICTGIPIKNHPGSFGVQRKHERHTGIDLYADEGENVHAVEPGTVVCMEAFTGPKDNSPWWNDTDCVLVEGASGVVCYGEIDPSMNIKVGGKIARGEFIGRVKRVLKSGKERLDIAGHKPNMLHMELYPHKRYTPSHGFEDKVNLDPTPFLLESSMRPSNVLE